MPEVWPEVAWILGAFGELSASRAIGMGTIGFVPLAEVATWADMNGVEDVATFARHLRAIDAVYVADWAERQKRDAETRRQDERRNVQGEGGA